MPQDVKGSMMWMNAEFMTLFFSCIVYSFVVSNTLIITSSFPCGEDKPEKLSRNLTSKQLDWIYSSKTSKQAIDERKPKTTVKSSLNTYLYNYTRSSIELHSSVIKLVIEKSTAFFLYKLLIVDVREILPKIFNVTANRFRE